MNGLRLEFSNAWRHSKLSFEKKSISMNFGSIMERKEKRFVYRIRRSSDENNDPDEWRKELRFPVPRNAVDSDSKCLSTSSMVPPFEEFFRDFNRFKWKRLKKYEVWALWGVIWTRIEWDMAGRKIGARVFERERSCRFQNLKFEYIGAGTRCNRLHKYGNRLPESNIVRNNCL